MLVFVILQLAPDSPFDRAVKQLKNPGNNTAEVSSSSNTKIGNSGELSEEVLEKLRAQYGLDKPIPIRYLVWLGLYPRETNNQEIVFYTDQTGEVTNYNESFSTIVDELIISDAEKLYLQKYINVQKVDNKFVLSESGAGLEFSMKSDEYYKEKKDLDQNIYNIWKDNYSELPDSKYIKTWYKTNWEIKENSYKEKLEPFIDENENGKYDQESFTDTKNKIWDIGEPFVDEPNGYWDYGEKFTDQNENGKYDFGEKFVDQGNGKYDFGEKFTDQKNGYWDKGEPFIDENKNGKYDQELFTDTNNNGIRDIEKISIIATTNEFSGILQGDIGFSKNYGKKVSTLIYDRLNISLVFGITSLILTYLVCIPLGIIKGIKNGSQFDLISSIVIFIGYSIPGYILGTMLIVWITGADIAWPTSGWQSPNFEQLNNWNKFIDRFKHALLPVACYMIGAFAWMTVLMKNSLLENLSQDYVRTAFAKGLSEKRVIFFHAVRNSLIPLATGIGGMITVFLSGSYLIERAFSIPGMGLLGLDAIVQKDYDIMMGVLAVSTILVLIGNLISDIVYSIVDPRIRFK